MDNQQFDTQEVVFLKFNHKLPEAIKHRFKTLGCQFNTLYKAWTCPLSSKQDVDKTIDANQLRCQQKIHKIPSELMPQNPHVGNLITRIDISEQKLYSQELKLFADVVKYDSQLRPADFDSPPSKENKTNLQALQETDFHERRKQHQEERQKIETLRAELQIFEKDKDAKTFNSSAPLPIVRDLIIVQFLNGIHRTLHYHSNSFWIWNKQKYEERSQDHIRSLIYQFLEAAKIKTIKNEVVTFQDFNPNKHKVNDVIDALQSFCLLAHCPQNNPAVWLDNRPYPNPKDLIFFQNGILDIESWIENQNVPLLPHSPLMFNTNVLPFNYDPNAAKPDRWLQLLSEIWGEDTESIETLQEFMGYYLTQDTCHHKILLIIGPTRSGKGTIGRVIEELIGKFNMAGPTLSSFAQPFGLQPLLNKTLAVISDARLVNKIDTGLISERLLRITGEDILTVDIKHRDPVTGQLPIKILMMSNELPVIGDASSALANRYIILEMKKSWLGREDPTLSEQLRKELPGIILWGLKGLQRLRKRNRFVQPSSSSQSFNDFVAMTSPVKAFVKEKCEIGPTKLISVDTLHKAWMAWSSSNGNETSGNKQQFGKDLRAAYPYIDISQRKIGDDKERDRYYLGISLLKNAEERGISSYNKDFAKEE